MEHIITIITSLIYVAGVIYMIVYNHTKSKHYDRFINLFDLDKLEQYSKINEKIFSAEKKLMESRFEEIIKDKERSHNDEYNKLKALSIEIFKAYKEQQKYIEDIKSRPFAYTRFFMGYPQSDQNKKP